MCCLVSVVTPPPPPLIKGHLAKLEGEISGFLACVLACVVACVSAIIATSEIVVVGIFFVLYANDIVSVRNGYININMVLGM